MPRHPDGAHHIDLEESFPVVVGDFEKGLRLEDAEIVDEDIGIVHLGNECAGAFSRRQISGNASNAWFAAKRRCFDFALEPVASFINAPLRAAIEDNIRSGSR